MKSNLNLATCNFNDFALSSTWQDPEFKIIFYLVKVA